MTQEDKELLLQDLCARLPYGIKASYYGAEEECETWDEIECITFDGYVEIGQYSLPIESIKPYLFPLSSMTDKQAKEIQEIVGNPNNACIIRKTDGLELWLDYIDTDPTIWLDTIFEVKDYLNKKHFDYRDLIGKGLAIDASELNIYKTSMPNKPQITIGTKICLKSNPDEILTIISDDCHEDEFECSDGSVLSLKQIKKYYDII